MKKILLFTALISFAIIQSQVVNIPDNSLKQALINSSPTNTANNQIAKDLNGNWFAIDINNDNQIQLSEANNVSYLELGWIGVHDLIGIQDFTNLQILLLPGNDINDININLPNSLTFLDCYDNNIPHLDISNNLSLEVLSCGSNNLTNLDVSSNESLRELYYSGNNIQNIDLSNNINLIRLDCGSNNISNLDISNNINLEVLNCDYNNLVNLNLSNNINLIRIHCEKNNFTNLNFSNNINLENIDCWENILTSINLNVQPNLLELNCANNLIANIDVSQCNSLNSLICADNLLYNLDVSSTPIRTLFCRNNPNLSYINLKNGNNDIFHLEPGRAMNLPNLETICIDDVLDFDLKQYFINEVQHSINFTKYCSFTPTQSNEINGNINIDITNNGCDTNDIPFPNIMLLTNNGTENFATFTQNNGDFLLYTNEGSFTTSVTTNLPNYYSTNPNSLTNIFTGFDNTFTANFCVEPNQTVNDVNISLLPTSQARPGFNTTYQIVYKNVGTTQLNGNVTLEFDETKLSFLNASETVNTQTTNSLTFDYTNLNPFETRTINLEFNVFAPPTVNIDDVLNFTATINPIASDFTADDNIFTFNQTVIGSYDPNDITVLEGNQILLAETDKYLHYVIRFQNTGTASAINVVVTNNLDANLDWSTLQLESLSHNNRVAIKNGNEIEFIFENINLPDSTTDEPNSHGFIAYKIKPKADIVLDDIILNKADIFFDYNEAVETNTATTTIVNVLAVNENTLLDFSVYPIPTENILNVNSKTEITKMKIYNKLGQLIKETTGNKIDISNLRQGLYFVKVEDVNGNSGVKKVVKKQNTP